AISVIDFSKDEPFSGSTTNHFDALPPSSSPVKTSENLEEFADELTLLKKGVHEENFQVYSNPLFEFDDHFNSSNENPLFNEMVEDVVNENSNVANSNEPVFLNTPLSDKVECSDPEVDIDEIDAFLAIEVSSNVEEGYYDSEGDAIFLEKLLSDDTTHNLAPEVISDHKPKQNESITFYPRSDPLHHEFAGELLTLPSRIAREHEEYLSLMTLLYEISTSRSPKNVHANSSSITVSLIPVEDSDPVQKEIDIFLVPDDLIPPGVENDDFEDEDNSTFLPENKSSILEPSSPRPPPEPPDVCLNFKPDTAMKNDEDFNQGEIVLSLNVEDVNSFTFVIWTFLPSFTYPEDSPFIISFGSEDLFWNSATSKTVNNVSYIKAKVAGKVVSISEASIRRDLLFNDADGIDCLTNSEIIENLQLKGYEGDLTILTFQKALFSPQWKYLSHTLIHCLSSKSTSWDQFPTNIASAMICLATDRKFNFSKLIFEGMIRNLDAKKKFLIYPRFVQVFLNSHLSNLPVSLDNLPIHVLTKKVFTNMVKKGLHFLGHVTPLFPNMLTQAVVSEGEGLE
ncbi:hypothetical protein Tco_1248156, partial [Tanacetum coccineum]